MNDQHEAPEFRASFPKPEAGFRTSAWLAPLTVDLEARLHAKSTLDALEQAARETVGVRLYTDDAESMDFAFESYTDLYAHAGAMAGALRAKGIRAGDRVVLLLPTGFAFLRALFALQWLGAVPVPTYPPAAMEKLESSLSRIVHIANDCGAKALLTVAPLAAVLGAAVPQVRSLDAILVADELDLKTPAPPRADIGLHDPCFIQYTSGSTGLPKGVLLSHRNILCNIHATGMGYRITRNDSYASWLPLYHDMGLIGGVFNPVYWRTSLALMSPMAFLMKPIRWLRMISENKSTLSAAPNFAYGLVAKRSTPEERATLDLRAWRMALSGAEPVNTRTVEEFRHTFGPCGFEPGALFPAYGLAECSLAVSCGVPGQLFQRVTVDREALASGRLVTRAEGDEGAITLACVGKVLPGHQINIVDERGEPLDYGEIGHIVVSGPSVMQGYYSNPEATSRVLQDGWLWTGDLGFLEKEGLYVAGRAKDLIIVRGKNYYAEDLERCVELQDGVRPSGVVAFAVYDEEMARDAVICVVETKLTDGNERAALAEKVSESVSLEFGIPVQEVLLVEPGAIPRTSSGKRQRSLTRQRYLAGSLEKENTGGLKLARVFAKSAVGHLALQGRKLTRRRVPEREE